MQEKVLKIGIELLSMTGQQKIVEIELKKKEIGKDSIVNELCTKNNLLDKENKNFREELKEIKSGKMWRKNKL